MRLLLALLCCIGSTLSVTEAFVLRPSQCRSLTLAKQCEGRRLALSQAPRGSVRLFALEDGKQDDETDKKRLPMLLDPNTRGGIIFLSIAGTLSLFALYAALVASGVDGAKTGVFFSVAVTVGILVWTGSYVFRVANKDMTYVKQLKDYEDAVLRKRLEELQEDEVSALLAEVEKEQGKN